MIDIRDVNDRLTSPDADTRLTAALELGSRRAGEALPVLVDRVGLEQDFQVREVITWAIVQYGHRAGDLLVGRLDDADPRVREQAAHVLSKLGGGTHLARLATVVSDEDPEVAMKAYRAAAATRDPAAVPMLVARLGEGPQEQRDALDVALASLGEVAVGPQRAALADGRPQVRQHAADALAQLGSPAADAAVPGLASMLDDEDAQVRLSAVSALATLDCDAAAGALLTATNSSDARVRAVARRLVGTASTVGK